MRIFRSFLYHVLIMLALFQFPAFQFEEKKHLHEVDLIRLVIYSLSLSHPVSLFYFISSISNHRNVFCSRPLTWNWEHAIQLLTRSFPLRLKEGWPNCTRNKATRQFHLHLTNGIKVNYILTRKLYVKNSEKSKLILKKTYFVKKYNKQNITIKKSNTVKI